MLEVTKRRYCKNCKRETSHIVREDMLEIEQVCMSCNKKEEIVKTFF